MSRTEYRFDGLDALEQQLSRMIEEEYPAEFRAMVIQIAHELQGKVKEKTPHKTGRLQDRWKVGPIVKKIPIISRSTPMWSTRSRWSMGTGHGAGAVLCPAST